MKPKYPLRAVNATGNVTVDVALLEVPDNAIDANGKVVLLGESKFDTLTDGATITWTFAGGESRNATVTLGGNRTLALSGCTSGASGTLRVVQDNVGSRTLALPSGSKVIDGGAGAVTLTTTGNAVDILSFLYLDSTHIYWTVGLNFT